MLCHLVVHHVWVCGARRVAGDCIDSFASYARDVHDMEVATQGFTP